MTMPGALRCTPLASLACLLLGVLGTAAAQDASPGRSEDMVRFEAVAPCPFPHGAIAESRIACGFLHVPENRLQPDGPRVQIPVVRVRSAGGQPKSDPIVFLHGGPGAAPLESGRTIERFSQHPFAAQRDIILFNQRGSAQTHPALTCQSLRAGRIDVYAADLTLAQRDARIAAAAGACLREIAQERDLAAYGAAAAAADLKDLREALRIERWNVLAVSYGTLIALEASRIDPQGIRSLVLDSVVSPQSDLFMSEGPRNFSIGVDRLLDACEQDAACAGDFPDLRGQLREVLAALENKPVAVTVAGEGGRGTIDIVVNWHDFLGVIHWMLYSSTSLRQVPLLIDSTRRGDLRLLTHLMDTVFPAPRNGPSGASPAFFAFVCRDQFTIDRPTPLARSSSSYRGFSIATFVEKACASAVERARRPPGVSDPSAPALLLSGRFDPMTPDVYAREVLARSRNATLVSVGNSGHSTLSDFDACQTRLALEFVETLTTPKSCAPESSRPAFVRAVDQ